MVLFVVVLPFPPISPPSSQLPSIKEVLPPLAPPSKQHNHDLKWEPKLGFNDTLFLENNVNTDKSSNSFRAIAVDPGGIPMAALYDTNGTSTLTGLKLWPYLLKQKKRIQNLDSERDKVINSDQAMSKILKKEYQARQDLFAEIRKKNPDKRKVIFFS